MLVCDCKLLYSNAKPGQNHQKSNRSFCNNKCIGKQWHLDKYGKDNQEIHRQPDMYTFPSFL